jgi:hypothetical protein
MGVPGVPLAVVVLVDGILPIFMVIIQDKMGLRIVLRDIEERPEVFLEAPR